MFRKLLGLTTALSLGLAATSALAQDALIEKVSNHSVTETLNRLEAAVTAAGATVFARVDHSAGATKVDIDLRPTELLIFGNPKIGSPAMVDGQTAGLDLPLRVLAYADAEGVVRIAYHSPDALAKNHALPQDAKYLQMMKGALDKLTNKAVAAE
ncbi:DUF302 domain-containing protein [Sulfitobacter donghicola]|uniref:Camphor resistance protein CrcB n=1 Tax=Sulfitobacter donghicola DSW-25 = KCTC 12864 = JCM 14565 TaxID=1300350 RepID=A0A073IK33_9RHOB|nr:DUF302 domain-containing protein [Sulfitobacter donghicola]KEJ90094.1 camphor resistance protein CrcB [Sulfitobacter donghicola DSW-25 = KCTC 12864 = JCM 14565]KIN66754.1 CrcB family protein [Sulfitobacter donghicola DSW-25 = KCTC 12864 = JCM 14565]